MTDSSHMSQESPRVLLTVAKPCTEQNLSGMVDLLGA